MKVLVVTYHADYAEDGTEVKDVYVSRECMELELIEEGFIKNRRFLPNSEYWDHPTRKRLRTSVEVTEHELKE